MTHKGPKGHKGGLNINGSPAGADAGPAGRCWREARPRQRQESVEETQKKIFLVFFVAFVLFVKAPEAPRERRIVVSSCKREAPIVATVSSHPCASQSGTLPLSRHGPAWSTICHDAP
jgi:hypothetical protein